MKPQTILFIFFALLLAACAAQPATQVTVEATATPQPTATMTATVIPTASATPTPAETKLTAETIGSKMSVGKWSFVDNANGNVELMLNGAPVGVEAWQDKLGVNVTYDGEQYAFANQDVILKPDGTGRIGRFEVNASGELTPIPGCTAAELLAGKDCGAAITIIWEKDNDVHLKLAGTVTDTRDLLMGEDIPEAGNLKTAVGWTAVRKGRGYFDKEGLFAFKPIVDGDEIVKAEEKSLMIAFQEPAIFPVKIIDRRDPANEKVIDFMHIPVIAKETEGAFGLSALVPADLVKSRDFLEGKKLDQLLIWLVRGTRENLHEAFVADPILLGLEAQVNNATVFREFSTEESGGWDWGRDLRNLPKSARQALFTLLIAQD
ncbi:hypothetical protein ANAEL_04971 [Anaerolineales bacterium]|nr:hypothetical protein ANAEL_04971 [Anaerolineales bacterium]